MGRDDVSIICASVPEDLRPHAEELARNVLTMERKLEAARMEADDQPLTVKYDRGGIHKNPFWEGYTQLFNAFSKGLAQLTQTIEAHEVKPAAKTKLAELRVIAGDLKKAQ